MATPVTTTVDRARLTAIADRLRRDYGAARIILFGSAARDMVTAHSDIDLLVIAETRERFYERAASVLRTVRELSYGLPLAPIVLTAKELQARLDRGDQFMAEVVGTGVDL
ncbi:MAG: nucleotidyltransferase domain-containing protein [Nitrospira sp.]|nr:MAG: nucleotidyltransferase domain-containing protein [Nitrospira sp.]